LREDNHRLREENQTLRDEVARLKRQKGKPKIAPSRLNQKERKKRRAGRGRGTRAERRIDRTEVVALGELIVFRIVGSHFLWKMVRRLAGILVEMGRGSLSPAEVERMLTNASEIPARCTAPPSGLFLAQVLYEGDRLGPLSLPLLPLLLQHKSACGDKFSCAT